MQSFIQLTKRQITKGKTDKQTLQNELALKNYFELSIKECNRSVNRRTDFFYQM